MNNPTVSSPNDFKVVDFTNTTDFTFTPEMGCMYDGRPIFGITGAPGINAGESLKLPYHIGHRLATNLAKMVMVKQAPMHDPSATAAGAPINPLWSEQGLEILKNSFLTELYSEEKPASVSETDKLMAKVEEYKKMVDTLLENKITPNSVISSDTSNSLYQDKADVIAELNKREIKFDARKSKAELEKLIV